MTARTPRIDPAQPPEGQRLELLSIATELGISLKEMTRVTQISRTAFYRMASENLWPTRVAPAQIRTALIELFSDHGASEEQVLRLFDTSPVTEDPDPSRADEGAPTDQKKVTDMLLPKQTLSRNAMRTFKVFSSPFDGEVIEDAQMFTSGEISYVREAYLQAAKGGRFVAVVGESGAGKTTIQADLEARIEREKMPVIVIKPWVLGMEDSDRKGKTLKSADILGAIVTTLDPLATMPQTLQARSNLAYKLLTTSAEAGFSHLLVIEEAHSMPDATLKHLKRLNEMRLGRKPLLGILLLGQTELGLKLDPRRANLREVTQRCEVVQLMPLDGDLQPYLAHRAQAVGRELADFIDAGGIDELRARLTVIRPGSGGKTRATSLLYPLAVNNLLTAALNMAAEIGAPLVSRDVVRAV